MSDYIEVQRIVKRLISSDIWQYPEKLGWVNDCVFRNAQVDPHNVLIKMGQSMELIYPEIARIRYPGSLFPRSIAGFGVSKEEEKRYFSQRYESGEALQRKDAVIILTRLDEAKTKSFLTEEYVYLKQQPGRGRLLWDQDAVRAISLRALKEIPLADEIREVNVDLCPCIDKVWTLIEVKLSGNCDSGKTRDMLINNMLEPYVCLGQKKKELYFGIISDNLGSNRYGRWRGTLGGFIDPQMILREGDLFDLVAPEIEFEDFQEMVCHRLTKTKKLRKRRSK